MEYLIVGLTGTILSLWLGSMEMRVKNLTDKLLNVPTRDQVEKEVELRIEVVKALQLEIKEDIKEIKRMLDR